MPQDRSLPPERGAVILLSGQRWQVHAGGAADAVYRQVFRVDQQSAVDDWTSLEHQYQPWHQQSPRSARPRHLSQRIRPPAGSENNCRRTRPPVRLHHLSDSRTVRVPLPSVAPGSIVEYEIRVRDLAEAIILADELEKQRSVPAKDESVPQK